MSTLDPVTPAAPWIAGRYAVGPPRLRLFCLPPAGGGASTFNAWRPHLPPGIELAPVELPGRGSRIGEPVPYALGPLADGLLDGVRGELDLPYALFGHSFGAVVAYELTRRIERRDDLPAPAALLVSAHRAPHVPLGREPLTGSDDRRLAAWLHGHGGLPGELLEHPGFLSHLLRAVRADLELAESYLLPEPAPVRCPLVVLAGADDDVAAPSAVEPWAGYGAAPPRMRVVPGGHSYPRTHPEATLNAVTGELRRLGLLGAERDRQG
ncbi:thioesterase II family protein [Streptomyces griseomycini]|uniref:Surfactin synthase thioesterase subunit n=1 Tax=Streptomyces griseomycini TaxID=66895 RepID=A0A7W7PRD0_9ACTN|nr:thioesterase [Streptomyces griseomycini]MBB4898563.1 surfactin synthase thioesterase subunit [Streptomyces griseomycini]GGQ16906.1 thioesterase [Streptomyces griseomycini]GGR27734.1 thioesterase [Streptomyces griseomycini]